MTLKTIELQTEVVQVGSISSKRLQFHCQQEQKHEFRVALENGPCKPAIKT